MEISVNIGQAWERQFNARIRFVSGTFRQHALEHSCFRCRKRIRRHLQFMTLGSLVEKFYQKL